MFQDPSGPGADAVLLMSVNDVVFLDSSAPERCIAETTTAQPNVTSEMRGKEQLLYPVDSGGKGLSPV